MRSISSIPVYTLNKLLPNKISIPIFDNCLILLESGTLLVCEGNKIKRLTLGELELTKICKILSENYKKIDTIVSLKSNPLENLQKQYEIIDNKNNTILVERLLYELLLEKFGSYKLLPLKELKDKLNK